MGPDGTLGVIDFGMVGTLDEDTRRELLLLLAAWVERDADGLAAGLLALGVAPGSVSQGYLRADMRRVLSRYHDARLADLYLGRILSEILRLARRHHLALRGDLALMTKTLAMHEGVAKALDPHFLLAEVARPSVEAAMRQLYAPRLDRQHLALNLGALFDLTTSFPQRAQRLLSRLERGDLAIAVRPDGVEPLMRDLNRMVNRLSVSILAAAFIVGAGAAAADRPQLTRLAAAAGPVRHRPARRRDPGRLVAALHVPGGPRALTNRAHSRTPRRLWGPAFTCYTLYQAPPAPPTRSWPVGSPVGRPARMRSRAARRQ